MMILCVKIARNFKLYDRNVSSIHKNIKKDRCTNDRISLTDFLQNRSQHGHCLNAVSCAGVLADQRFCKKSVNGIRFSYLYLFYVFMNTRYISVIQIRI